jgi:hypothetical protein
LIVVTLTIIPVLVVVVYYKIDWSTIINQRSGATFFLQPKQTSKEFFSIDSLPTENQNGKLNLSLEHVVVDESSPVKKENYNSSTAIKTKKRILPLRDEKRRSSKNNQYINDPSWPSKIPAHATKLGDSVVKETSSLLPSAVSEECSAVSSYSSVPYARKSAFRDVRSVLQGKEKEEAESMVLLLATEYMNAGQDLDRRQLDKVEENNEKTIQRPIGCYIPLSWLISSHCRHLSQQEPLFDVNSPEFMRYW